MMKKKKRKFSTETKFFVFRKKLYIYEMIKSKRRLNLNGFILESIRYI